MNRNARMGQTKALKRVGENGRGPEGIHAFLVDESSRPDAYEGVDPGNYSVYGPRKAQHTSAVDCATRYRPSKIAVRRSRAALTPS